MPRQGLRGSTRRIRCRWAWPGKAGTNQSWADTSCHWFSWRSGRRAVWDESDPSWTRSVRFQGAGSSIFCKWGSGGCLGLLSAWWSPRISSSCWSVAPLAWGSWRSSLSSAKGQEPSATSSLSHGRDGNLGSFSGRSSCWPWSTHLLPCSTHWFWPQLAIPPQLFSHIFKSFPLPTSFLGKLLLGRGINLCPVWFRSRIRLSPLPSAPSSWLCYWQEPFCCCYLRSSFASSQKYFHSSARNWLQYQVHSRRTWVIFLWRRGWVFSVRFVRSPFFDLKWSLTYGY